MEIREIIRTQLVNLMGSFLNSNCSRSIFYHDIHEEKKFTSMSTSSHFFESHVKKIRDLGYTIVHDIDKEIGQIEISFDDGFQGVYDNINVIDKLNVPIRLFVVTSFLDKKNYLSKSQLQDLSKNPLINIGSHTHTHPFLNLLSEKEIEDEINTSRSILQDICNVNIQTLCYPYGMFNNLVVDLASKLRYKKQYSSIPGYFSKEIFDYVKARSLVQFASDKHLENILMGGDVFLSFWYKKKHFSR